MKGKQRLKITVDAGMTILLLALMAYPVTGQLAHEWTGAGMFLLLIAHHVLNGHWYKGFGKGSYKGMRMIQTVIDILLLIGMLALMFSGMRMSRYVFPFLPGLGSIALARRFHLLASYWGFVLMSVHLGLHWSMVMGILRRMTGQPSGARTAIVRCVGLLIGLYGAYSVWTHQLWQYLFLRTEFVWMDPAWSGLRFFLDHLAMMGLFALLAHCAVALRRNSRKGAERT